MGENREKRFNESDANDGQNKMQKMHTATVPFISKITVSRSHSMQPRGKCMAYKSTDVITNSLLLLLLLQTRFKTK